MKHKWIMIVILNLIILTSLSAQQPITVNYRDIDMFNPKNVGGFTVLIGNMKEQTDSTVRQIDFRKFDYPPYVPFNEVWGFLESNTIELPAGNTKLSFEWKFQSSNIDNVLKADSILKIEHQVFDVDSQKVIAVGLQTNIGNEIDVLDTLSGTYRKIYYVEGTRSFELNSQINRNVVLRIRVNTAALIDTSNLEWYTETSSGNYNDSSDYYQNDPYLKNILPPFITNIVTSISQPVVNKIDFLLDQNYPNPFNPATTIRYSIPENISAANLAGYADVKVILKVYDILGREVVTLVNKEQGPGNYEVQFNATNLPAGRQDLPSGVYIYRLTYGSLNQVRKMILLK